MMGLAVLLFFAVYLLVSIRAVNKTVGWAKANDRKPWLWGGLAAFAMYNLVFWDFIPTLIAHKYYCSTQAGFWVYKTPEQWRAGNPDLTAEELKPLGENKEYLRGFPYKPLISMPNKKVMLINKRIYLDSNYEKNIMKVLPIHKYTNFIADIRNDQKMAQQITFGSGYGNPMTGGGILGLKEWISNDNCSGLTAGDDEKVSGYRKFLNQIIDLGK